MLKIGKTYRTNGGDIVKIGGPTRDNPSWVWSVSGSWYDKETGAFISYGRDGHKPLPTSNWRSIAIHTPASEEPA